VRIFTDTYGQPSPVYIVGASEGGLVTTLAVEQHPEVFDGGLCACGPIGNFDIQTGWFGDFRVLFDYYFPGLLPGDPETMPQWVIDSWGDYYENTVRPVLFDAQNAKKFRNLVAVTRAPFDPFDYNGTIENSIKDLLWYNVFATNDAVVKLGGPVYDNQGRWYTGVWNAWALNRGVHRYTASPVARQAIANGYQTTGNLHVPLVTIHTLWDPQVPYRHMPLYNRKTLLAGAAQEHINIPIARYDHCQFEKQEVLLAFALLVLRVEGPQAVISLAIDNLLPNANAKQAYRALAAQYGVPISTTAPAAIVTSR
jgi:pimeloyl-ACP methyl ester carboxylesterase